MSEALPLDPFSVGKPDRPATKAPPRQRFGLRWLKWAVALFWIAYLVLGRLELFMFYVFLGRLGLTLVLGLFLLVWWPCQSAYSWPVRLGALVAAAAGAGLAVALLHPMVLPLYVAMWGVPTLATAGFLWLVVGRRLPRGVTGWGVVALAFLAWLPVDLVRMEGLAGDGSADVHPRWSPTGEEAYFAKNNAAEARTVAPPSVETPPLIARPGDWTAFRGTGGDGRLTGVALATDWAAHPPILKWKHPLGPGWSSLLVVDGKVFTQEVRGPVEVIACYDAETGTEVWATEAGGRFEEPLGGSGPRATPAFADGKLAAFGARGRLDVLDAATGRRLWSHEAATDHHAGLPMWGYASSPTIVDGRVIVIVGGADEQAVVAYDLADGSEAWTAAASKETYSSPQVVAIGGTPQLLCLGNERLTSFDPATGAELWRYDDVGDMGRPTCQPQLVGDSDLLVTFDPTRFERLHVEPGPDGTATVTPVWTSRDLRPDFSDYLVHEGYVYGFSGDIFACIDLATGKRAWKGGRYGAGQALLLADQGLILVVTEQGELVLLRATPERHTELARLPALDGKTWNHPVIAHGRLYLRNGHEIACYDLPQAGPDATASR